MRITLAPRHSHISMGALVAAVVVAAGTACSSRQSTAPTPPLAPAAYRQQIEAVETALYPTRAPIYGDPERAAAAITALHVTILARETNPRVVLEAAQLLTVAGRADAADVGYAPPDLGPMREGWETARATLFGHAAWFHTETRSSRHP